MESVTQAKFTRDKSDKGADEVAAELIESAQNRYTIRVTVGVPLTSDGAQIRFGAGEYDPFEEKRLISLPNDVSDVTSKDLLFAADLASEIRRQAPKLPVNFSISAFDAKMVHSLGSQAAARIEEHVARNLFEYLPPPGRELYSRLPGGVGVDFSLRYRRIGDKFADRLRRLVRPPVPSVPTSQAMDIFESSGALLLKQLGSEHNGAKGMGRVVFATPNTVGKEELDPLHGRGAVQRTAGGVILTNSSGDYICEVTAIGRLLAMARRMAVLTPDLPGINYSIINVREPGSYKLHRMTWAAGEVLDTVSPFLGPKFHVSENQYWARVSDGERVFSFDSREDRAQRDQVLSEMQHHTRKRPHQRIELLAGKMESIRARVQNRDPDETASVLLFGPGDYSSEFVTNRETKNLSRSLCEH